MYYAAVGSDMEVMSNMIETAQSMQAQLLKIAVNNTFETMTNIPQEFVTIDDQSGNENLMKLKYSFSNVSQNHYGNYTGMILVLIAQSQSSI